jgi:hypothetical protein
MKKWVHRFGDGTAQRRAGLPIRWRQRHAVVFLRQCVEVTPTCDAIMVFAGLHFPPAARREAARPLHWLAW